MKTWSGERGARILLVDSQVVLPAFSRPGRGARHDSERTQRCCVKKLNLNPAIVVWRGKTFAMLRGTAFCACKGFAVEHSFVACGIRASLWDTLPPDMI